MTTRGPTRYGKARLQQPKTMTTVIGIEGESIAEISLHKANNKALFLVTTRPCTSLQSCFPSPALCRRIHTLAPRRDLFFLSTAFYLDKEICCEMVGSADNRKPVQWPRDVEASQRTFCAEAKEGEGGRLNAHTMYIRHTLLQLGKGRSRAKIWGWKICYSMTEFVSLLTLFFSAQHEGGSL